MRGFPDPEYELDGLGRLNGTYSGWQDTQDPALGATRHEPRRRRLGVEAAVAWAFLGVEDARLTLEAEDRTVHVRLAREHARVVDEVARGEVVRAVDDDVEVLEDVERVLTAERLLETFDVDVRVYVLYAVTGALHLRTPHVGGAVDDLALQVGLVDDIEVHDAQGSDPRRREVHGEWRTQPPAPMVSTRACFSFFCPSRATSGMIRCRL